MTLRGTCDDESLGFAPLQGGRRAPYWLGPGT